MTGRDIALTGVPRGGTTLACQLLGDCEGTVALFEPMDVLRVPADIDGAIDAIGAFYGEMRHRLTSDGTGISKHRDGVVPDNPFDQTGGAGTLRRDRTERGMIDAGLQHDDFTLVVKHNALFTGLLPELASRLPVLAIVRNPLAVLASWNTVDLPVGEGRLPAGERIDPDLRARLQITAGKLERQCIVLDWFFGRFRVHLAPTSVLRYEDMVATHGRRLWDAAGLKASPRTDLRTRNASPVYAGSHVARLAESLARARTEGHANWSAWYTDADVNTLAEELSAGTTR